MRTHRLVTRFATLVVLVVTWPALADTVLYSQPPLFGNGDSLLAEINGGQQADNWVANTSTTINMFRWWGTLPGAGSGGGAFTLRIFSNSGGLPGSLINSFSIGNAFTRTFTGNSDLNGRDIYKYEANLTGGFTPTSGATYWLNIMNDQSVTGPPPFLWHQGSGGNNAHAFRIAAGSWSAADGDMAFELVATAAPCPANIVTIGASATQVDVDDLLAVISAWGACPAPPASCPANIVTTGASATQVDVDDLLAVISGWGPCP